MSGPTSSLIMEWMDDSGGVHMFNVLDEFGRESLALWVCHKLCLRPAVGALAKLFSLSGMQGWISSDSGVEVVAVSVRRLSAALGACTVGIEPAWAR